MVNRPEDEEDTMTLEELTALARDRDKSELGKCRARVAELEKAIDTILEKERTGEGAWFRMYLTELNELAAVREGVGGVGAEVAQKFLERSDKTAPSTSETGQGTVQAVIEQRPCKPCVPGSSPGLSSDSTNHECQPPPGGKALLGYTWNCPKCRRKWKWSYNDGLKWYFWERTAALPQDDNDPSNTTICSQCGSLYPHNANQACGSETAKHQWVEVIACGDSHGSITGYNETTVSRCNNPAGHKDNHACRGGGHGAV